MEDVITDIPPPSRFFNEDLNNFALPSPALPSPFFVFSKPDSNFPLRPSLLVVAISPPSIYLLHHCIPSKTLIGTLILPEISFSGNPIEPSHRSKSCDIYASIDDPAILFMSVQLPVAGERAYAVAKLIIDEGEIRPERVLILDSVQSRNFRGNLSADEMLVFKLETSSTSGQQMVCGVGWFPSGSMVDGLGAALLTRCQMRRIQGTLCVSWPECGPSAVALVKSLLDNSVLSKLDVRAFDGDCDVGFDRIKDSELYA
ncbi:PREDICTED: uncharacterized protein LOC104593472 [Nelumbo nucifera]|uniref:Proteasome assembly chaperone 1 n=2 Tax=Nelumbo nucifera TaxID=4432 RepID=A0A822ZJN8_NELNU|nr:PREDICTED: uncharacterized protein LOC104593472 [Nelumbo nucifera]DAD43206.1 TPA_asm: hypothetical protein HUJ06_001436 [Nelumbo nucifera]